MGVRPCRHSLPGRYDTGPGSIRPTGRPADWPAGCRGCSQAGRTAVFASTPVELIEGVHATLDGRVGRARESFGRPQTLAEKILVDHLDPSDTGVPERGATYVDLRPDRAAMQDATAQMADQTGSGELAVLEETPDSTERVSRISHVWRLPWGEGFLEVGHPVVDEGRTDRTRLVSRSLPTASTGRHRRRRWRRCSG